MFPSLKNIKSHERNTVHVKNQINSLSNIYFNMTLDKNNLVYSD
jgi:hypothetical protein